MVDVEQQSDAEEIDVDETETVDELSLLARSPKLKLVLFALGGTLVLSAGIWFFTRDEGSTSEELMLESLAYLDERENEDAREKAYDIAKELQARDYRNPEFSGGVEYVLGISAFRDAASLDEVGRERHYRISARLLRNAEQRGMPVSHFPEWSFALGMSLFQIGFPAKARPHLENAVEIYEVGKIEASALLADIYLDLSDPELHKKALLLNNTVVNADSTSQTEKDRAYLQRAQIYLALGQHTKAEEALTHLSSESTGNKGTIIFQSQTLMAEGKYEEALALLEDVSKGVDSGFARQALYLMGVCAEKLKDIDMAITNYVRTAERYEDSHEGVAANLKAGNMLRRSGRDEEALERYRRALKSVTNRDEYGNRRLSLEEFQNAIKVAWEEWVSGKNGREPDYADAIALSRLMPPLIPEVNAAEFNASANQQWAEYLEQKYREATVSERKGKLEEIRKHWRMSGKAYADLAELLKTTNQYGDALWVSAEHYRQGHDFWSSLNQLNRFINTRPKTMLPKAHVARGEVLMDLDQLDEALKSFQRVLTMHPTDPAALEAMYLIGNCHLERSHLERSHLDAASLELAEKAWRDILTSNSFQPSSREWKLALFSLGRLMFLSADMKKSKAESLQIGTADTEVKILWDDAFTQWKEAIRRLDEFLKRYSGSDREHEARFLLAKSLQNSAELPRRKLKSAETDNARQEQQRAMQTYLKQALFEFNRLRTDLLLLDAKGHLDNSKKRMLRDCYFESAHTDYSMGQYKDAIGAYSRASNRYPDDPQVLLAYVQMTNCYDRLGMPSDARIMLEQASIILKQMKDESFEKQSSSMNRAEWELWLKWLKRLHQAEEPKVISNT